MKSGMTLNHNKVYLKKCLLSTRYKYAYIFLKELLEYVALLTKYINFITKTFF